VPRRDRTGAKGDGERVAEVPNTQVGMALDENDAGYGRSLS